MPTAEQMNSVAEAGVQLVINLAPPNCADGIAIELYTIIGGKHAWPGGDQPTQSISATKLIWEFFVAHSKE
jgi:poly(3-hydroxybutyrate) depolymerase